MVRQFISILFQALDKIETLNLLFGFAERRALPDIHF